MTLRCGQRIIRRCIERPYVVGMAEADGIGPTIDSLPVA